MKQIDINSPEFQEQLIKTEKFVNKIIKQFGWEFNPDEEVTKRVILGLANNKLKYNKYYCPCFVPQFNKSDRICPCKPAINEEIPNDGICHCGIFCTPQKAAELKNSVKHHENIELKNIEIDGLKKDEIEEILQKEQILGNELEILLKAREKGLVDFELIDIREPFENQMMRIKGTDKLLPISRVQFELDKWNELKDKRIIIYCHVGSRSGYLQRALQQQLGFNKVGNLTYGIADYMGDVERG